MRIPYNELVAERPLLGVISDVSEQGLRVERVLRHGRSGSRIVQLEFELPGTGEIIWAGAECRFDAVGSDFHLTGLRFTAMARKHERLIRDYVRDKEWMMERMWLRLRRVANQRN
jgi:hypothetical protein